MVPFDWRVPDRLGSIVRTYAAKGVRLSPEEHSLTALFASIAAGATSAQQTLTFPMEGQFVWYGTAANIMSAAGVNLLITDQFAFEVTPSAPMVLIRNGQNRKTFSRHIRTATSPPEGFAPVASIAGTGQRPFILPFPMFFNPGDFLELQFFNGGAVACGLQLTLLGWKLTQ